MFANGSSNKGETNRGKKAYGSFGYRAEGIFVEAMAQYERAKLGDDDIIGQVFGVYSGDWGRVGLQYAYRRYKYEGAENTLPYNMVSIFAVIKGSPKIDFIARWDSNFGDGYEQDFAGDKIEFIPFAPNHEFNFILGAVSWQAHNNVWLIPNIKYTAYSENELLKDDEEYQKPGSDIYANFTLWFKF
jgi:hypothetical protein